MWVISVNYLVFWTLIFHDSFFIKESTSFVTLQRIGLLCSAAYDGILKWKDNPLCVVPRVGYYAFLLQQIARPRNTRSRFHLFYQKGTHAEFA